MNYNELIKNEIYSIKEVNAEIEIIFEFKKMDLSRDALEVFSYYYGNNKRIEKKNIGLDINKLAFTFLKRADIDQIKEYYPEKITISSYIDSLMNDINSLKFNEL